MDNLRGESRSTKFFTVVSSKNEAIQAKLLIESLRTFGGKLQDTQFWIFLTEPEYPENLSSIGEAALFPLEIEAPYRGYELAEKVFASARAEELAGKEVRSLVWLNLDCLIVNPPLLFELGMEFDAAFRPVHVRNVGSAIREPMDNYWQTVYQTVGIEEASFSVESFVDAQVLRPYFNTHCFAINPSKGILQNWLEYFKLLVADKEFQAGPCLDRLHRIFLHQVVLSALIVKSLDLSRIRRLPPAYSYPLHLLNRLPVERRIPTLNQTVCPVYEEANQIEGIVIQEPLKSWLQARR